MINISSTSFQTTRRRFPLRPKSVRTPPARFTLLPASPAVWKTETITATPAVAEGGFYLNSDNCFSLTGGLHTEFKDFHIGLRFESVLGFIRDRVIKRLQDKFWYGQGPHNDLTISLHYQVPAQPACKEPRPLSKKLKV